MNPSFTASNGRVFEVPMSETGFYLDTRATPRSQWKNLAELSAKEMRALGKFLTKEAKKR